MFISGISARHGLRAVAGIAAFLAAQSSLAAPYSGTPIAIPSTFHAERYDTGGEGIGYHDNNRSNLGGQFRTREGVDISLAPDAGNYIVNYFETGEWLLYTIKAPTTGTYDVELLAATTMAGAAYHLEVDGRAVTARTAVPVTTDWSSYQWQSKQAISLTAGTHTLVVKSDQQYFNFDAVRVTARPTVTPYSGTAATLPGTIEAETYDRGGQGLAYYDTTSGNAGGQFRSEDVDVMADPAAGGGYFVSHFETGDWVGYTVNVPTAGSYDIEVRAATMMADTAYHIEIDGAVVTDRVTVPVSSSWNTYQWVGTRRVSLTAGRHFLKVVSQKPYFSFDALRVVAPGGTAKLLFKSGFDGGAMSIQPPLDCWGTGCWQDLVGLDSLSGFNWPGVIGEGSSKFLHLTDPVVTSAATLSQYSFNRIESATAPKGGSSSALFQQISKNVNGTAPMGTSPAQNEFQFLPKKEPGDMYVSYWLKLQPDMVQKMTNLPAGPGISGGGTWRAIFAFKTGGQTSWGGPADNGDYRVEAYVMTYNNSQPYWVILGDNNAGGGAPAVNNFRVENRTVPVPVGQWFKVEFFWHRSSGTDGRVWMAVNGQVVADRRGANMGAWNLPINRIMAPMLYSGSAMPIYQWVEDLEIWDGFPTPGANTPYAPH